MFAGEGGAVAPADGLVCLDSSLESGAMGVVHVVSDATSREADAGADVNEAGICRQADGRGMLVAEAAEAAAEKASRMSAL